MAILEGVKPDQDFEKIIDRSNEIGKGGGRRVFDVIGDDSVIKEIIVPTPRRQLHGVVGLGRSQDYAGGYHWQRTQHRTEGTVRGDFRDERVRPVPSHGASGQAIPKLLEGWLNDQKPSAFGKTAATETSASA